MRLSIARTSAGGHTPGDPANRDDAGLDVRSAAWRRMAIALAVVLILGCIGIVFGSSKPAGAEAPFSHLDRFSPLWATPLWASTARVPATHW